MPQTVIITGASRGIGLAATESMLRDGARVVAVHRSSTKEFSALLNNYRDTLRVVQGDFTKEGTVKEAIDEAQRVFGGLDSIVLNAAVNLPIGTLETLSLNGWHQMFDVNLFGVVTFVQGAIPTLRKSDASRIVLVSSEAANLGIPGMAAYSASKAALNSLNRTIAAEERGITAIAFHPGAVRTEMLTDLEREGKGYVPDEAMKIIHDNLLEPDVPGRVLAGLALRAPKELSGEYVHWNDPRVNEL